MIHHKSPSQTHPVSGLTQEAVEIRRNQGLINKFPQSNTKSNWAIIQENVFTLFNAINIAIGVSLALVGAWANMAFLLVVFLNSAIGTVQQLYAKRLVEKLSLLSLAKTEVLRNDHIQLVGVDELVLDDVCILEAGRQICADARVLHGTVEVNESLLTGEADPIPKTAGDELLSGSFVVSGKCYAQVVHVGVDNFVNQLSQGARKQRKRNSQLLKAMGRVTKFTGYFILPVGILHFIQAYFLRSTSIYQSVVSTAASLLGMLPKGLVLLISISLAAGVIALSRKKVLVQELHCIETLAHVNILCLDKTGTITQGKMRIQEVCWLDSPEGFLSSQDALESYLGACEDNNATVLAMKEHFACNKTRNAISKIAFSSDRKWGGITFDAVGTYLLGAPEVLLKDARALPASMAEAMKNGDRIVCFGCCRMPSETISPPEDVMPLAYIRICDPVREDAKDTLAYFAREGVAIKVISGDNPITVSAVAQKAGLKGYDRYIDLSVLKSKEEVWAAAEQYTIFGRVSPNQKCDLIKALQAKGHTVAMTGDGVNDVLALRQADCGIAIGSGSDAARQVSQLVLLDSNFSALPDILKEGRRVVNNITRVARLFFIKTLYSAFLSLLSVITFTDFPFIPIQITLMDAFLEAIPSFALSFEPDYRKVTEAFLPGVIRRALPYAILIFVNHLILALGLPLTGITEFNDGTVLYYITGFIYLLALLRTCVPFNLQRSVLCLICAASFYLCTFLFAPWLQLEPVSLINIGLFAVLAVLSLPPLRALVNLAEKKG